MPPLIGATRVPKRLILSYVLDWIVIILIAIVGAAFSKISPNHRPFNLADPNIAFPYVAKEKISTGLLTVLGLVVPAIVIVAIVLIFVPGPTVSKETPKTLIWRRKLWEWNTAWLGLGLAVASALFLTDGMKNLFGKPRPDLLSRCIPDVPNLEKYVVGGYGGSVPEGMVLVSWKICTQTDLSILNDGFVSFPSGHSSFSWAGLTYLTLFLCAKFAITIPYLLPQKYEYSAFSTPHQNELHQQEGSSFAQHKDELSTNQTSISSHTALRSQAAAPPTYILVLAFIPVGLALYISSTRYSDFMHHGFDIIFGSLEGFLLAWGSFRWYHAPIRRGAGWSWGPRSVSKAFGVGIGIQGYAGEDGEGLGRAPIGDVERGGNMAERTANHEPGAVINDV